ncbi:MAG: sulfate/thiosulfate ABC transporter permease CysW, partial [Gammaproteobacteria bacterium]|nr:sulfate/thiosulfate ABC transporter permease CysW [Gammaproteobacteria bacterium]MBU1467648.1 sulfate/thiosulfate ABC transporter permease CysW [Gammaproteobacteria bacterium]
FASASLLAMIALLTLLLKAFIEWRQERSLKIEAEKERQVTQ